MFTKDRLMFSSKDQSVKVDNVGLIHCKNKLVILTTEWLPWLQSSWRNSGYERFALV